MTADWTTWLDRLEAGITAQRAALTEGRHDDVLPGQSAVDLGPLPPALETRARDLLQANATLTAELAAACASHGRLLRLLGALEPPKPSSAYLDTRT